MEELKESVLGWIDSFGLKARDTYSGFAGKICSVDVWNNGCIRVGLQPEVEAGKSEMPKVCWIDSQSVEILEETTDGAVPKVGGGPMQDSQGQR